MDNNIYITYAFLAQINNSDSNIKDLAEIFIPLVEFALTKYASQRDREKIHGKVTDLKEIIKEKYHLDIPYPILVNLLKRISKKRVNINLKINKETFIAKKSDYKKFEERQIKNLSRYQEIQREFEVFLKKENSEIDLSRIPTIYDFIEKNKMELLQLFNKEKVTNTWRKYYFHAKFVKKIRRINPDLYQTVREIYLGSLISSYIEIEPLYGGQELADVELVLDTSFIISLLKFHPETSSQVCNQLFKIAKKLNFKISVLDITINETKHLFETVIKEIKNYKKNSDSKLFTGSDKDMTNYCIEKNITQTKLLITKSKLVDILKDKGVEIINTNRRQTGIEKQPLYKELLKSKSKKSAFHDTCAILYVQDQRTEKTNDIHDVNCWFLQDYYKEKLHMFKRDGSIYEKIDSHVLLSILWLSYPTGDGTTLDFVNTSLTEEISYITHAFKPDSQMLQNLNQIIQDNKEDFSKEDLFYLKDKIAENCTLEFRKAINKSTVSNTTKPIFELLDDYKKNEQDEFEHLKKIYDKKIDKEKKSKQETKDELLNKECEFNKTLETIKSLTNEISILRNTKDKLVFKLNNQKIIEDKVHKAIEKKANLNKFFLITFSLILSLGISIYIIKYQLSNWDIIESSALVLSFIFFTALDFIFDIKFKLKNIIMNKTNSDVIISNGQNNKIYNLLCKKLNYSKEITNNLSSQISDIDDTISNIEIQIEEINRS